MELTLDARDDPTVANLRSRSRSHAEQLSWRTTAEATVAAYRLAADEAGRRRRA